VRRVILGLLLAFIALNAFGGGWYGLAGAKSVPTTWLAGSPFTNYVVPSLVLIVVVGGTALTASLLVFRQSRHARQGALCAGLVMIGWIAVQVAIIGSTSWLQPAVALAGLAIVVMAWQLPSAG
jgi:hypothetical protein